MDASFFSFALIGALVGYIIGDFQRERRYRRDARANLARAVSRTDSLRRNAVAGTFVRSGFDSFTVPGSYSDGDDDGAAYALGRVRDAGSRAVRGTHYGTRPDPLATRGGSHRADEASMSTATKIAVM